MVVPPSTNYSNVNNTCTYFQVATNSSGWKFNFGYQYNYFIYKK